MQKYRQEPVFADATAFALTYLTGSVICDLGPGAGDDTAALRESGHQVVGVDVTTHLHLCPNGQLILGSALDLPLGTASVDGVLANRILHHIPDGPVSASEIARVLTPGGTTALVWPDRTATTCDDPAQGEALRQAQLTPGVHSANPATPDEVRQWCVAAGLVITVDHLFADRADGTAALGYPFGTYAVEPERYVLVEHAHPGVTATLEDLHARLSAGEGWVGYALRVLVAVKPATPDPLR
jgi:SAM-dependent methyltransferase